MEIDKHQLIKATYELLAATPDGLDYNQKVYWAAARAGYVAYGKRMAMVGVTVTEWESLPFHVQDSWFIASVCIDAVRIPIMMGDHRMVNEMIEDIPRTFKLPMGANNEP